MWALALTSALGLRLDRTPRLRHESAFLLEERVENSTNESILTNTSVLNASQDRLQPVVENDTGTVPPEEDCNNNLLLSLESDWVSTCYHWDSQDPNIAAELRQWVNYAESSLTARGSAQVCVEGEACIQAVHAYYAAFVEEGCAERANLEATYKLAHALETAADACTVVGPQAMLNYTPPSVNVAGHPNTLEGCYHDYPDCMPHCLMLPARPTMPGAQRMGELYYVHGISGSTCYRAKTECQGCLFRPEDNPDDLQPWNCPDVKCAEVAKFNEADAPVKDLSQCEPVCLGHPPCGHDGCGGQCGVCPDNEECVDNACVWRTFEHRFAPKDEREVPEWYEEEKREERKDTYTAGREASLEERLFPDFGRSTLASKLGIAGLR